MKKTYLLLLAALATAPQVAARGVAPVGVDSLRFDRHGEYMVLDMNLDLRKTEIPSGRAQIITPMIVSQDGDTVPMHSVGVYGRQRYINFLRNNPEGLNNESTTTFKAADRPDNFSYSYSVPYNDRMNGSKLIIRRSLFGCANCLIDEKTDPVAEYYHIEEATPPDGLFRQKGGRRQD